MAYPVYDTVKKFWHHLNSFQQKCYIQARVPRLCISEHEVKYVDVLCARMNSGFTMLFEAHSMGCQDFRKVQVRTNQEER